MKKYLYFILSAFICIPYNSKGQIITTIAGGGVITASDGGPATLATLSTVMGVFCDGSGSVYILNANGHNVRRVNSSGIISTFAGSATSSFGDNGDGGPATAALFTFPYGGTTDGSGNIYITDYDNTISKIRKINTSGIISTFAGGGIVLGDGGPATAAKLRGPYGVAIDAIGNLYIADANNNRVRKVNTLGVISTVAGGTPTVGYSGDGGPATSAQLNTPVGVAVDASGNLYIADKNNYVIRKVNPSGIISTFAGNNISGFSGDGTPAITAQITQPWGVCTDVAGNIYIADYSNNRIRKVNTAGIITTVAGNGAASYSGDGSPATAAGVYAPTGVYVNSTGNIYISQGGGNIIRLVTMPTYPPSFTGGATQSLTVCESSGANAINTLLAVNDPSLGRTLTWSIVSGPSHGTLAASYVATSTGGIVTPTGLTYTPTISYLGADAFTVQVTDGTTTVTTTINVTVNPTPSAGTITGPSGVCVGSSINMTDAATGGTWSSSNTTASVTSGGVVTGAAAGTNVISYSVTNSCGTAVATHTITISAPSSAGTITGPSSVCVTASITLSDAITGGTWSSSGVYASVTGAGVVTGVSVGTETITYAVTNVCGTASVTTTINVGTGPSPGTISGSSTVCVSASITLSVTVTGGTWSSSSANATVTSGGVVTGVTAGTSTITYTVTNSCGTAVATHTVTINTPPAVGTITGASTVCVGSSIQLSDAVTGGTWSSSGVYASASGAGMITGVSAGTETITYTITNSCGSASVTTTINVGVGLSPGTISGSSTVCLGTPITLSETVTGGTWSSSNANATITSGGVVTGVTVGSSIITYTLSASCGTTIATYPITISATPSAGTITGPDTVCVGNSITLTNATGGGVWSSSNADASITGGGVVTGATVGIDTIIYTVTNACGSINAKFSVNILPAGACNSSITNITIGIGHIEFEIYPNPASQTFNAVINSDEAGDANVNLSDITGKVMMSKTITIQKGAQTITTDASQLAPGIYFVTVNNHGKVQTQKLVIMR